MARRATLTPETLAALGAERLAKLVLGEAQHNAPFKRTVTAALAAAKGADAVAAVVDRRLASLERARGFVGWSRRKAFAADLKATVAAIEGELGALDPCAAALRLLRFLRAAGSVFERVDDAAGTLQAIFEGAAAAVAPLVAGMAEADRLDLLGRVVALLRDDEEGLIGLVVRLTVAVLSAEELAALDRALEEASEPAPGAAGPGAQRRERTRRDRLLGSRQAVADALGDVDSFIALEARRPGPARDSLGIAERLLQAGRIAEALGWARMPRPPDEGEDPGDAAGAANAAGAFADRRVRLEIRILAAGGDREAAQRLRWTTFAAGLEADLLRAYVAALPDFEDEDALERAFALAAAHPRRVAALAFFVAWPRRDLASRLVLRHAGSWDGRCYDVLAPAALELEADHPAAATVLYRALIDDVLARARSPAYGHAARYLDRLGRLDAGEAAAPGLADHRRYRDGLRRLHGRKHGFWSLVEGG